MSTGVHQEKSTERMKKLLLQKKAVYKNIFDAILQEEEELSKLYQPLMSNLTGTEGTLNKLSFHVRRTADTSAWAEIGEQLLDMRKVGDFRRAWTSSWGSSSGMSAKRLGDIVCWTTAGHAG